VTAPLPETSAPGHRRRPAAGRFLRRHPRPTVIGVCIVTFAALLTAGVNRLSNSADTGGLSGLSGTPPIGTYSHHPVVIPLPHKPESYLGAFAQGVPGSYAPIESFAKATGVHLNVALYYSGWYEKFQRAFAVEAANRGATPFMQIDPTHISFEAIVHHRFDIYLETLATEVASYGANTGHGVIIGFGHEMNGDWYSWDYKNVHPHLFVAAWRHVVNVFRQQGADDVAWLWTVNVIAKNVGIVSPRRWWPGSSYVTWIGIDGYYLRRSWRFAGLFGPTIRAVRALSRDPIPILISETGASPWTGKSAKVADLFAGIRAYGLLGFVWFQAPGTHDWQLTTPAEFAAFRRGASTFENLAP
jgi:Glycosyl hydrolase family 26